VISVTRPKEGLTAEIKDTYTYDGNDLRASQATSGTTTYLTWNPTASLPLILNDGTNSYIYGPGGLPIEQINTTTGTVLYLHHDQQGSTRLLTGSTGAKESSFGYDAQYTSTDTGLIYLRARVYDPATAQFLSVDPAVAITQTPYGYARENPLNHGDPTGLISLEGIVHVGLDLVAVPPYAIYYGSHELARGINYLGKQFGLPGEVIAHLESLPLAQLQALGLAGDASIDALKKFILGHESICDEGPGSTVYVNPLHQWILGGPIVKNAPGIAENGNIEIEW
jgi:RHS repeat-associated protein